MFIRRTISVLTYSIGLLALAICAWLVFTKGFSIAHWMVLEKLLIVCVSFIAGALLWQGHRTMRIAGIVAWGLAGVWLISLVFAT